LDGCGGEIRVPPPGLPVPVPSRALAVFCNVKDCRSVWYRPRHLCKD
jgi:hypothetical protein